MPKFIITWDCGYGENAEVIEAENQEQADKAAYEAWREGAENQASYGAQEYTEELAADYDL